MKEYLVKQDGEYILYETSDKLVGKDAIEVPEGAEYMTSPLDYFWRDNEKSPHFNSGEWIFNDGETIHEYLIKASTAKIVWQRSKPAEVESENPWNIQVGGDHYKHYKIQPMQFALENNLNPLQHSVIKYVMRHEQKNGKQDLEKAKHYIDLMISHYYG